MALINPSNLYSEGQVKLDSTPYLRMQQQQQAKKQAREDALYKYFSELPDKINAAGMRSQDIDGAYGGFNKKVDTIRKFWDVNKQDILKGGKAAQDYDYLIRDAKQYADFSKSEGKKDLDMGKPYFEGKHTYDDDDVNIFSKRQRPIDDPQFYKDPDIKLPYQYTDLSVATPDFDANRQMAFDKAILGKAEPQILPTEKPKYDTNTYEVIYNKKYRPEDIYAAAERAAGNLKGDRSARKFFKKALDDIDQVKIASEALSKLSGTTVIAETPEQMAAGLKAAQLMNFSKEDRRKDVAAVNKWKQEQQQRSFDNQMKKLRQTHDWQVAKDKKQKEFQWAMKYGYENEWLEKSFSNLENNPIETIEIKPASGAKNYQVKVLGIPASFKKAAFENTDVGIVPDDIVKYPNGDIGGIYYEREPEKLPNGKDNPNYGKIKETRDGKKAISQTIKPIRMSRDQAKIFYGKSISSGKDLTGELSEEGTQQVREVKGSEKTKESKWSKYAVQNKK